MRVEAWGDYRVRCGSRASGMCGACAGRLLRECCRKHGRGMPQLDDNDMPSNEISRTASVPAMRHDGCSVAMPRQHSRLAFSAVGHSWILAS
jgi:hypothetical protein